MNKRGAALIFTFFVIMVMLIFSSAFVAISINQNIAADIFKRRARALCLAEAGLDHTIFWLRGYVVQPVTGNFTNPWGGAQNLGGGSYSVVITDLGQIGANSGVHRYMASSTGTYQNMSRILTNYVQVDNYARYLWFTNSEVFNGTDVWFWTQDTLNGPMRTNGHFNIYGNPTFGGEAGSVDDYIRFYNNGNNINLSQTTNPPYDIPVFQQGLTFGVEPTTMPHSAGSLRAGAADSANGGVYLTGNTTVALNSDGTMNLTNSAYCVAYDKHGHCTQTCSSTCNNRALPTNGALFVNNGTLTISGTLHGRLTVGASGDVIIPANIAYSSDPRVHPESTDTMGIISEADVTISSGASTNLEIDSCVMALSTSFMLNNWSQGPAKGTLTVFGGIIQDERGPVGTFNPGTGQKLSGYSKNYTYDTRLLAAPPPFMPTTGDYLILSWEED